MTLKRYLELLEPERYQGQLSPAQCESMAKAICSMFYNGASVPACRAALDEYVRSESIILRKDTK